MSDTVLTDIKVSTTANTAIMICVAIWDVQQTDIAKSVAFIISYWRRRNSQVVIGNGDAIHFVLLKEKFHDISMSIPCCEK